LKVKELRRYNLPDVADHVIHFTGRNGPQMAVDEKIKGKSAAQRLTDILIGRRIRAFGTFGSDSPVVCFTESVRASVSRLIAEQRYTAWGIGFDKEFVFGQTGGPAFYVRGDEWPELAELPQPLRCRAVRFWPGADPEPGVEHFLPNHLASTSEWLHEREWRVPGDFTFGWSDVKFLIAPEVEWQPYVARRLYESVGEEYASWFMSIPAVVVGANGAVLRDEAGIWAA
jgi:hypothetical protein